MIVLEKDSAMAYVKNNRTDSVLIDCIGATSRSGVCDDVTSDGELGNFILEALLTAKNDDELAGMERMLDAFTGWGISALFSIAIDDAKSIHRRRAEHKRSYYKNKEKSA